MLRRQADVLAETAARGSGSSAALALEQCRFFFFFFLLLFFFEGVNPSTAHRRQLEPNDLSGGREDPA